jgi:linoleoyl-CoA desaturase
MVRPGSGAGIRQIQFGADVSFQTELARRIDAYFAQSGRRRRDSWQMYMKTTIILAGFALSYLGLVFRARSLAQGLSLSLLLIRTFGRLGGIPPTGSGL